MFGYVRICSDAVGSAAEWLQHVTGLLLRSAVFVLLVLSLLFGCCLVVVCCGNVRAVSLLRCKLTAASYGKVNGCRSPCC